MGILNKIFGVKSKEDDFFEKMTEMMLSEREPGRKLADHIVLNILAKGHQGSLKDMEDEIKRNESNPIPVCTGLKERLIEYRDSGVIVTFSAQAGDTIIVHKDFVDDFMRGLK
jgi:hypothetical protein